MLLMLSWVVARLVVVASLLRVLILFIVLAQATIVIPLVSILWVASVVILIVVRRLRLVLVLVSAIVLEARVKSHLLVSSCGWSAALLNYLKPLCSDLFVLDLRETALDG